MYRQIFKSLSKSALISPGPQHWGNDKCKWMLPHQEEIAIANIISDQLLPIV